MRRGMGKNWIDVFQNMKRFDARKCLTEQLAALGLLRGRQDHAMRVPFCSRSGDVVELLLKPQWWVLVGTSVGCPHVAFHPNSVVLLHCWQILMTKDSVNIACRLGLILFLTYFDLFCSVNPLNTELIPICHLLALLEAHHILHVSRELVNVEEW